MIVTACVLCFIFCLGALLFSPLWFPIAAVKAPETTACSIYASSDKHDNDGIIFYFYICWWVVVRFCRWFYAPLIACLPMRYRAEFIRFGIKRVSEYPTKVQIAFFKSHDNSGKQSLLASNALSPEARAVLWNDKTEWWDNWLETGMELSVTQIEDLCKKGTTEQLWRYFKHHTPNKEQIDLLLRHVREGYAAPAETMIKLIRQQRPNGEMINKLLLTQNDRFIEKVNEVVDLNGDMDAVEFGTRNLSDDVSEEEKQRIIGERWTNFCKHKKEISRAAQKKMSQAHYKIFVETGHRLEYYALQHLCLNIGMANRGYLCDVIRNEFDNISPRLLTALKTDYWRYSVYLAVEQERKAKSDTE